MFLYIWPRADTRAYYTTSLRMKNVKINKIRCPNAIYIYIYIYIGRRPRRRPKIKEKLTYKGRRQRRRPPDKSRKSLHTKGADRGADFLKEKKSKQICRIPLDLCVFPVFSELRVGELARAARRRYHHSCPFDYAPRGFGTLTIGEDLVTRKPDRDVAERGRSRPRGGDSLGLPWSGVSEQRLRNVAVPCAPRNGASSRARPSNSIGERAGVSSRTLARL